MSRRAPLQRRPLVLAAAAATGVIAGHLLDALSLLPGVHESAAVRATALAPKATVLTVLGAGLLAVAAEGLLRRRRPWLAVSVLVTGQTALLAVPEAIAEAAGRVGGAAGGEAEQVAKLSVAVGLQVVLALVAVGLAVVVDTVLLQLPSLRRPALRVPGLLRVGSGRAVVPAARLVGGVRGRDPPAAVVH